MTTELNQLKTKMGIIDTKLEIIQKSLDKNDDQHEQIMGKIDHLNDTFQGKIQDKADHKEVLVLFDGLEKKFVSNDAFRPVQKVVYALVGATLLGVIAGVMAFILRKP